MILRSSFLAILLFASADALNYLSTPERANTSASSIGPTKEENECSIIDSSGDGEILVCTSSNGQITALDPKTLNTVWNYAPEENGSCETGIAFSSSNQIIHYGITTNMGTSCRIQAMTPKKESLWNQTLKGACSGTPVVSFDGQYVFVTTNTMGEGGVFTILKSEEVVYQFTDQEGAPLSPLGIYHNPTFGNYGNKTVGGLSNDNDIVVWANRPDEEGIGDVSTVYAFQFPTGYDDSSLMMSNTTTNSSSSLSVTILQRKVRDPWKTVVAPTIVSDGLRMYWSATKSKILAWTNEDERSGRFNRVAPRNEGFGRGIPAWEPVPARVATTKSLEEPIIFTGTADNEFHAMTYTLEEKWNVTSLNQGVVNQAQISPDDQVVYFVDASGLAYAYNIQNGTATWTEPFAVANDGVKAGYTQSMDGTHLYFVSTSGYVSSLKIAEGDSTSVPTSSPSASGVSPTMAPVTPTPAPIAPAPVAPTPAPPAPTSSSPSRERAVTMIISCVMILFSFILV